MSAGYKVPYFISNRSWEICSMRLAMAQPWSGPIVSTVLRTNKSRVPCRSSALSFPMGLLYRTAIGVSANSYRLSIGDGSEGEVARQSLQLGFQSHSYVADISSHKFIARNVLYES